MVHKKLNIHIAGDCNQYIKAKEVFKEPFDSLREVLIKMTRFEYPSGYAIIQNHIIQKIFAGDSNEYPLCNEISLIDNCIYIDNYNGPEAAIYGWKNLSRDSIEQVFNISFNEEKLQELGGFPNSLTIAY